MNARINPFFDNTAQGRNSITFPHGFLDFLNVSLGRRHRIGEYELEVARLEEFNEHLRALSPDAPGITMDQIATAAQRALERHQDAGVPPFVASRMAALQRLLTLVDDPNWACDIECKRRVAVLQAYRVNQQDLIPDPLPVVGLLDDAVLIDVALQLLHHELGDYEDFCRFRKVAAEFAGLDLEQVGITREHWIEAMLQARQSLDRLDGNPKQRFGPDPRVSLFHIT